MSRGGLGAASPDDLFEHAPCGYLTTTLDGRITRANQTFAEQVHLRRRDLEAGGRLQDLLTVGARLYFETHVMPLLLINRSMSEVALELRRADGSRLPALINTNLRHDAAGQPMEIRIIVFEANQRRRYEQGLLQAQRDEHAIAAELQHSLLAGELPSGVGFELAISYRASERDLAVGGDWYDAFWLGEEHTRVALVVGDVVGRGLHAATTMGQLRSAVRALASAGQSPSELITSLDAYVRRHTIGAMTTLVYADLDIQRAELRYACAGHPPPLILEPPHAPRLLWDGRSVPLAAFDTPSRRAEGSATARRGSTLLLYSDGLTERHADRTTDGLRALLDDVAALPIEADPHTLVTALGDLQRGAPFHDDLCLLAVRLSEWP
ncbi:MAG TPA: SpoIIE family protein phosphatase [Solirubrobacteraceae bacterium]